MVAEGTTVTDIVGIVVGIEVNVFGYVVPVVDLDVEVNDGTDVGVNVRLCDGTAVVDR